MTARSEKPSVKMGTYVSPRVTITSNRCNRDPRQPVHLGGRVMDGVKGPEKRDDMKRPVNPVLREIGDQKNQGNLDQQRQRSDGSRQRLDPRPGEQYQRRLQGENRQDLNQQRIDEEVREIDGPLTTKDRLVCA